MGQGRDLPPPGRRQGCDALVEPGGRRALRKGADGAGPSPRTRESLEQAIDLRFDLRNSLHTLAEFGRIEGRLREAETLARTLDDQRRLAWVSAYMSGHHVHTGGPAADVRALAQRVEAIGKTLRDVPLQVAAQYYRLIACHLAGDYRGTEQGCRSLIQSLQGRRARERFGLALFPAVLSWAYLALPACLAPQRDHRGRPP